MYIFVGDVASFLRFGFVACKADTMWLSFRSCPSGAIKRVGSL